MVIDFYLKFEQVLGELLPKIGEVVVPLIEANLAHWEALQHTGAEISTGQNQ